MMYMLKQIVGYNGTDAYTYALCVTAEDAVVTFVCTPKRLVTFGVFHDHFDKPCSTQAI